MVEKERGGEEEEHYGHQLVEQMEEGGHKNGWVEDSITSYIGGERGAFRVFGMQCTSS